MGADPLIPTSHEIWTFVGRPLADAPSACKQAAYDGKSKNPTALVLAAIRRGDFFGAHAAANGDERADFGLSLIHI